jgi:hypothetical protein
VRAGAKRCGISPTIVQKWRSRQTSTDARMGPKAPHSGVRSLEDEAVIVAFRRHTPLPLYDCLYALQPTHPHPTRSSLHRCLRRHGISRLPDVDGDKPKRSSNPAPSNWSALSASCSGILTPEGGWMPCLANASRTSRSPLPCGRLQNGAVVDEVCAARGACPSRRSTAGRSSSSAWACPEIRRIKPLEDENSKRKRLVADLTLDRSMLQDVLKGQW